jgi:hypothetical protein
MKNKKYSVQSSIDSTETDDINEAKDIAVSMAYHFGSSCIIDTETNQVIERY